MGKLICSRGYYCFAFCQDVLIKTDLNPFRRMTGTSPISTTGTNTFPSHAYPLLLAAVGT